MSMQKIQKNGADDVVPVVKLGFMSHQQLRSHGDGTWVSSERLYCLLPRK